MDTDLPPGTGINAAADWIVAEFTRISAACGRLPRSQARRLHRARQPAPNSRITKPTSLINIYAVLKGTDPAQAARRVLVTGHYDSRNSDNFNTHDPAPGANDDASGVAVSLESARVLSKLKFPSTIVFVAVAGEEQGLNGSRHLASLAKSEGWQLEAVLNNDIVGGDTTPGADRRRTSPPSASSPKASPAPPPSTSSTRSRPSAPKPTRPPANSPAPSPTSPPPTSTPPSSTPRPPPTAMPAATSCAASPPSTPCSIFRRDRFLRGGDHTSFNAEGFPAVRFTEWRENFDHQHQNLRTAAGTLQTATGQIEYGDLLQFVDFAYVANVARLNAATLATFASAPGKPQNVHVLTAGPRQQHQLTWKPTRRRPRRHHLRDRLARHRPPHLDQRPIRRLRHLPSPCPSPRTTSSSASAPSTPPATAAPPSIPSPPAAPPPCGTTAHPAIRTQSPIPYDGRTDAPLRPHHARSPAVRRSHPPAHPSGTSSASSSDLLILGLALPTVAGARHPISSSGPSPSSTARSGSSSPTPSCP